MNKKDWMRKYYPIPASEVKGTDLDLIDHCINKWEGLNNTEPYGLQLYQGNLVDSEQCVVLYISGESCALCENRYDNDWFYDYNDDSPSHGCTACPLARNLGRPCDDDQGKEEGLFFRALKNPQVMIDALKSTREMVEKESQ